jgi:hypothetical protein
LGGGVGRRGEWVGKKKEKGGERGKKEKKKANKNIRL